MKKVAPVLSLKAKKRSALAIDEAKVPIQIQNKSLFQKGKGRLLRHQLQLKWLLERKKGKPRLPRDNNEAPQPKGVLEKKKSVL